MIISRLPQGGGGGKIQATLAVTCNIDDAVITASIDGKSSTATVSGGIAVFNLNQLGVYTIKADYKGVTTDGGYVTCDALANTAEISIYNATLVVKSEADSTVTISFGGETRHTYTSDGTDYSMEILEKGVWTVNAVKGTDTSENTATFNDDKFEQTVFVDAGFTQFYGVAREWGALSTAWERTGKAVGFTATASIGTVAGHSDFENIYPWSDMKRTTLATGDVMVKIPEFYYRRYVEAGVEHIEIAGEALEGFAKHPGSGCYVGAYKTSSNNKSVSGAAPQVSQTRAAMRTNARAKGTGWGLIDEVAHSAIRMLYLVEFADSNSQAKIGRGWVDGNSGALNTGSCDSLPTTGIYLTGRPAGTDGKTGVIYRGIEDLWGNVSEWVDGLNVNDGKYYVCADPAKYADDTAANYTLVGYVGQTNWSSSYITKNGIDAANPWIELPQEAGSGSETTGYADAVWIPTGWRVAQRSGGWNHASRLGFWVFNANDDSTYLSTVVSSRLRKTL